MRTFCFFLFLAASALASTLTQALPINWQGRLGYDLTLIDNFQRLKNLNKKSGDAGSQEVTAPITTHPHASFNSYLFTLNPIILVNDAATIKGEITSGYGRGGFLGDDSGTDKSNKFTNAIYQYNTVSYTKTPLVISQLFTELYTETATIVVGRRPKHWGMGAVYHGGDNFWDHHSSIYDGISTIIKIGNFVVEPYLFRIDASKRLEKTANAREQGISVLYDNPDQDLLFGALYSQKQNGPGGSAQTSAIPLNNVTDNLLAANNIDVTDLYISKKWNKFQLTAEFPMLSGKLGQVFGPDGSKFKASALLTRVEYQVNPTWGLQFDFGTVSGHTGDDRTFEAMYLHPNFQIANLLFRYNLNAIAERSESIYDSYITNANFYKFSARYLADKWTWKMGVIYAQALQTAQNGKNGFNHTTNKKFLAVANQSSDLGLEFDGGFDYAWNQEIKLTADFGYLFTGDYYAFINSATMENQAENSFVVQIKTSIDF